MNPKSPFYQRSSFWAATLGIGVVAVSVAVLPHPVGVGRAYAAPIEGGSIAPETAKDLLRATDSALTRLAQAVEPAVVHIEVGSGQVGGVRGEGSGWIYRADGYVVTNDHVVNGMDSVEVSLTDGRKFKGKVIRSDEAGDIAVVKIEANDLPTIPLEDSTRVLPGQTAMAIGSPFGLENSVTIGHVSALDRGQTIGDSRYPGGLRYYPDLIQTDAAINVGNSGGALVNIDGRLIGMNTAIESQTGGSNGIGFALPSNHVKLIADLLIKDGKVTRAFMGLEPVALKEIQKKELGVTSGALVNDVRPGTPAEKAGLKKGDVITKVGDMPIATFMDVRNAMFLYHPGASVHIEVVRDHQAKGFDVNLEAVPKPKVVNNGGSQLRRMPFGQNPFSGNNPFGGANPFSDNPFGDTQPNSGGQSQQPGATRPKRTGQAHLGAMVTPVTDDLRAQFHIPKDKNGAIVVSTEQDSLASSLGMKTGDLITSFNGKDVASADGLVGELHQLKWGDSATISFSRWDGSGTISTITQKFTFQ